MPHVIAEAGATRLPVVATPDNGVTEQLIDGVSGLFAPYQDQRPHNRSPSRMELTSGRAGAITARRSYLPIGSSPAGFDCLSGR